MSIYCCHLVFPKDLHRALFQTNAPEVCQDKSQVPCLTCIITSHKYLLMGSELLRDYAKVIFLFESGFMQGTCGKGKGSTNSRANILNTDRNS